jgi:3' terminal RNA ribose 2'-O-methyltransferase Hen1
VPEAPDNAVPEAPDNAVPEEQGVPDEPQVPLARRRAAAVLAALTDEGATSVVDLGCGGGALLRALLAEPRFTRVLGVDVSARALETAARRLHLDQLPDRVRERITLLQSSLTYRDDRLKGYDAIVLMEVIEHVDPPRLPALARSVFGAAKPPTVLVTTPNAEYNVRYESLPAGTFRHRDHRFEWTRAEFHAWAGATAAEYGYAARFLPVGDEDAELGPATQLAVFRRNGGDR